MCGVCLGRRASSSGLLAQASGGGELPNGHQLRNLVLGLWPKLMKYFKPCSCEIERPMPTLRGAP